MKISFALPDDPTAPTVARRLVRQALAELGVATELIDDAVLATSELVANAVEHGGGPDRLELEHDSEQFTLRVFDRSQAPPHSADAGARRRAQPRLAAGASGRRRAGQRSRRMRERCLGAVRLALTG